MTVHGTHTADPQTWSYLTGDQTVRSTWRKPTQKVPSSWRATVRSGLESEPPIESSSPEGSVEHRTRVGGAHRTGAGRREASAEPAICITAEPLSGRPPLPGQFE